MKKALIGGGGHAREVMAQMGVKLTCFVDDQYVTHNTDTVPLSLFNPNEYAVMVAIGDSYDRFNVISKLPKETKYFTWVHPTALVLEDVEIGEGSFIGAYSILTTNIKVGKHAILSRGNQIGHDCVIGDYFSMMPGAIVSGYCNIGDFVYMGANSTIREKITVPGGTTIGMGSALVKNYTMAGVYGGVPAKKIK
jgi:sugar O-acyltransferase (sialic acid O-acetyltransferase NeuD family)